MRESGLRRGGGRSRLKVGANERGDNAFLSAPDAYRAAIRKSVSWRQFSKNFGVNAASTVGGAGGWFAGAALERGEAKEKDEKDDGKTNEESFRSGFFRGVSAFARSIGDSVKNAANAAGNATTSAANAVVESAKNFVPEKKPETALVFYRGDLLVFEDRIEKHGRKYYFNALKNLTIEKSVREITSVEVGSILGRTALGALNGAANGGLIGAVAGGVQSAIDAGDAKESKSKETRTEYSIGAPERLDREETIYSADEAAEANETLREILAALDAAGSTPALWKDGRRTDAKNFRFD